jgi:peptide-methionine (S)-S-oxide reductase
MFQRLGWIAVLTAGTITLLHIGSPRSQQNDSFEASATFAGGCFWCMQPPFDELEGVLSTVVGYTGGEEKNPTYKQVSSGKTGHTEAIRIYYDSGKISYQELVDVFWVNIDPTTADRQFCDWGRQYRAGIFYHDEKQRKIAEASKERIVQSGRFEKVVTEVTPLADFWEAEEYHQSFYKKNPDRYYSYREGCKRDARLRQLWGDAKKAVSGDH